MNNNQNNEIKTKARHALGKKAIYGEDIDLSSFKFPDKKIHESIDELSELTNRKEIKILRKSGFSDNDSRTSGSYLQYDHETICHKSKDPGVEVLPIDEAWEEHSDWLGDYWWKNVKVDTDKYTARTELEKTRGYFILAKAGHKITYPLQSCLFISSNLGAQSVHNIVIAEEKSDIQIITGCATAGKAGLHLGVSEFYVEENANITFTMIHNWQKDFVVRPRTVTTVKESGSFQNNYIAIEPVKSVQAYPTTILEGDNSTTRSNSILLGHPGSNLDIGSKVILKGENSKAEILSRSVSTGGTVIARGLLDGQAPNVKAHLECDGLILSDEGIIHAVPELKASRSDVDMSHEAAIGKVGEDQINYLMSRGLNEEEATDLIVRGFLSVNIEGLRPEIVAAIDKLTSFGKGF